MNTNKEYCTQNDGDCETCSLVNYGRDCRNNAVQDPAGAPQTAPAAVKQIDKDTFEREMRKAQSMQGCDRDRAEYWAGVQRGLRRAYHGESFGTAAEHALWLSLVNDDDTIRQQRGQGYIDGLAGSGKL